MICYHCILKICYRKFMMDREKILKSCQEQVLIFELGKLKEMLLSS